MSVKYKLIRKPTIQKTVMKLLKYAKPSKFGPFRGFYTSQRGLSSPNYKRVTWVKKFSFLQNYICQKFLTVVAFGDENFRNFKIFELSGC